VNELLKSITKSEVEVVILAADCDPLEVVMTLPSQCEEKNIPYCFVESKAALGRACGIKRPVVAAGVIFKEGSHLHGQILELKDKLEQLLV
jgi:U4/U6 small nuclear ribonucleoprotein SNU13